MKLKEALLQISRKELFPILCNLEKELNDCDYTIGECTNAYNPVIEELLLKKEIKTSSRIFINMEMFRFWDVDIENITDWEQVSSAEICCNDSSLDVIHQIAYILWELTYDGWTEKEQIEFQKELAKVFEEMKNE